MRSIGIKLLLRDGHYLALSGTQDEYTRIVREWQHAKLSGQNVPLVGTSYANGQPWEWSVFTNDVLGVHSFVLEGVPSAGPVWNRSGL